MGSLPVLPILHISASVLALVLGTCVLLVRKGDLPHRRIGRAYAISMLVVNATALCIYRAFGGFGPFHVAAVISLLTLLAGMRPVLTRPRPASWFTVHMIFMNWSVVGLYAAFVSEVLVRTPVRTFTGFGALVGLSTGAIMFVAGLLQPRMVRNWTAGVAERPVGRDAQDGTRA